MHHRTDTNLTDKRRRKVQALPSNTAFQSDRFAREIVAILK
jgi:hypothetical protein